MPANGQLGKNYVWDKEIIPSPNFVLAEKMREVLKIDMRTAYSPFKNWPEDVQMRATYIARVFDSEPEGVHKIASGNGNENPSQCRYLIRCLEEFQAANP